MTSFIFDSRDFLLWLSSRLCSHLARRLLVMAIIWSIYRRTGDPLALGLIGLVEAIPFLAVALWAGQHVDRSEKKPFLIMAEVAFSFCAWGLFAWSQRDSVPLAALYGLLALISAVMSVGQVAGAVYLQTMIPSALFSRAVAWNLATFMIAMVLGPLWAGQLLESPRPNLIFVWSAGLFSVSTALMTFFHHRPPVHGDGTTKAWAHMAEGFRVARSFPVLWGCMWLDMVAVLFGDAVALFPLFADRFQAGALGFGLLRAGPSLGSALLSLTEAGRSFINPSWRNLKIAVALFGLCMLGFALAPNLPWALAALILSGAVDGASVIIRQSLFQKFTPEKFRGRVSALNAVFISGSNELGALESGLTARWLGATGSVLLGAAATFGTVGVMGRLFDGPIKAWEALRKKEAE